MFFPTVAPANLLDSQARAKSFEAIAGYRRQTVDLTGGDRSERLRGLSITPEFFRVLGVPLMGETFGPNDPQRRRFEIIVGRRAFPAAQRRFQFSPGVVTGIGVRWISGFPSLIDPAKRENGDLDAIVRLRPGVSFEQAQAVMDTVSRDLAAAYPETNNGLSVRVAPLRDAVLGGSRRALQLLFACTGLVLLVACGNVANLLLFASPRATRKWPYGDARRGEMANPAAVSG